MKKWIAGWIVLFLMLGILVPQSFAATTQKDMRAVWISTVYNLDYPSTASRNNEAAQKNEFIQKLDTLQALGFNTVIVQVRPKADALYQSAINPWSDVLTGTQGKDPGYDPMAFMIQEAHKRGMQFHAWLNPYRVTTTGTDVNALSINHPAHLNPTWVFKYNNALYYNPEIEGVKKHIVDTVTEIATNYDVDGIHFDDYFYPSSYPLPAGQSKDGEVANARRAAVNDMVKRVGMAVRNVNQTMGKNIAFGISPAGIWKNATSDPNGSNTAGNQSYYSVYADTRTWIKNNWIDYVVPQIYWQIGHTKADYETLVSWWSKQVQGTNVTLYIGQGVYNDAVAKEIDSQLAINQKYSNVKGSIYFSLRDILNNRQNCKQKIKTFYDKQGGSNVVTGDTSMGQEAENNTNVTYKPNQSNQNIKDTPSSSVNQSNSSSNGYASANTALSTAVGKVGTVTADTLNVRTGARVDREIMTTLNKGQKVSIIGYMGDWYKVKLENKKVGWVSAAYIEVSQTAQTHTGTSKPVSSAKAYPYTAQVKVDALNVRSGARIDREVIARLSTGTKVTVLAKLNGWYKIKLTDGKVGWASASYIE